MLKHASASSQFNIKYLKEARKYVGNKLYKSQESLLFLSSRHYANTQMKMSNDQVNYNNADCQVDTS